MGKSGAMGRTWLGALVGWAICTAIAEGAAQQAMPRGEHPRPDFRRGNWVCLNGPWQFRFDPDDRGLRQRWHTGGVEFQRSIVVPFAWQSKLSAVADTSGQKIGWYRRTVKVPEAFRQRRVWLRFGAVDWQARVWVNGHQAGGHEGGYTPFAFDVTPWAPPGQEATIVVRAADATDPELPCGKQGGRWHTPTSGIWQTVWLEARPETYLKGLGLTPRQRGRQWALEVELEAAGPDGRAEVEIAPADPSVQGHRQSLQLKAGRGRILTELPVSSPRLWTPQDPHLYELEIRLTAAGADTDTVHTYFGLRTIARGGYADLPYEAVLLNGRPIYLRGALDRSFNPQGIYTAPSDEFMRRDVEIAKAAGFNLLRIQVKSEEPRRLYWADRLGLLVIEDMPCTWRQSPRARRAWEQTMRATIRRDRNHPAVIAWCLFNQGWGLGDDFSSDTAAQQWVLRTWTEVKQNLDPSRLVDDNSSRRGDHVSSDLNSWQFCIDDYQIAREHIEKVVAGTRAGSPLNYVAGRSQGTAPLWCAQYGAVGPQGGDRDVSWGFRHLTTQLRRHGIIQGYVYAGLCDVEWEHNGVVNYDRSAKEFGYGAFVPEMTIADLQGADFVGFDGPPALEVNPGEEFSLAIFVSHFSGRTQQPTLKWQLVGTDSQGRPVGGDVRSTPVTWRPYEVTFQQPLRCRVPSGRPFVGALVLELLDGNQQRIAANFINLIARRPVLADPAAGSAEPYPESPRVEVLGPRLVAVRFGPGELASFRTDDPGWDWLEDRGKFCGYGACEVQYHLALPRFVREAIPTEMVLIAELATKADHQRLDWPAVRCPLDYPQTQPNKYPGKLSVLLNGHELWRLDLPDDPADARGVLSHRAQYQHGSYGYLVRQKADMTGQVALREALRDKPMVPLVFRAVGPRGGLSIYGSRLGRYPIDPTIIIQTARDLSQPPGFGVRRSVAVHQLLKRSRVVQGMRTAKQGGHDWRWTTRKPPAGWTAAGFDDSSWRSEQMAVSRARQGTPWPSPEVWLRTELHLPARPLGMVLQYFHDEGFQVYVNGKPLLRKTGHVRDYQRRAVRKAEMELFHEGRNVIAAHGHHTRGGRGFDLGISWLEAEPQP